MQSLFAQVIPDLLRSATAWDNHASLPWINWHMGGIGRQRVAALADLHPLGRSLVLLFFPGTITLYYGDELDSSSMSQVRIRIVQKTDTDITDLSHARFFETIILSHGQDDDWSSVMAWNTDTHAGFSSTEPWRPLNTGWEDDNVENQNHTISVLSTMVMARQEKVRKEDIYCYCNNFVILILIFLLLFYILCMTIIQNSVFFL